MGVGMEFIAYVRREQEGGYGVRFPDFPECLAQGKTMEEARERAGDALTRQLTAMVELGKPLPVASTLDDLADNLAMQGTVALLVSAEPPEKTVRVNITARASQLEAIDRLAKMAGMTRSAFLVQTAMREGGVVGRRVRAD
jgi:predicted RNase H-like HicB family nuclease